MNEGEIIFEPSRNRILAHWANHDTGSISAFRVFDWPAIIEDKCKNKSALRSYMTSYEENLCNNSKLRAELQYTDYGYIEVEGRYIDRVFGEVLYETSLFVFDKDNKGGLLETLHLHR